MSMYKIIDSDTKKEVIVKVDQPIDRSSLLEKASEILGIEISCNKTHNIFLLN